MNQSRKERVMNLESESIASASEAASPMAKRPRASSCLWRPWSAKLWWGLSAIYWVGKLGSYWSQALDDFYSTAFAGYLNIFLYPITILMVLGVGFVHAWMDHRGLEWGPPTHDQLFPKRSVGGFLDPMADPLDPRSPRYWHRHDRH
jgi:hypothetical protein